MELELKFQVPASRRAALRRAVATASARTVHLRARYADTADGRLEAAGLALRLRLEGARWVQALKGTGDGVAQRLEHEVAVAAPGPRATPTFDPRRHDGEAGRLLQAALQGAPPLVDVLATDIRRLHRRVASGGAVIEIAYDEGCIEAAGRRADVAEIEFELLSGPPAALPALAARWVRRFDLWWDVRTKAERGRRLARGIEGVPPLRAAPSAIGPGLDSGVAFGLMLRSCLAHALPNLAEIADGRSGPEHLHQLRVALRRLRTVLRDGAGWCDDPAAALALEAAWRAPFGHLGAARDVDVLMTTLLPRLAAAGAPAPVRPPRPRTGEADAPAPAVSSAAEVAAFVRGRQVQGLLLQSLALAMRAPAAARPRPLPEAAPALLGRAWRRALGGVGRFERAGAERQHRTRKRLKRLRYLFDFLAPLYPGGAALRLLQRLADAGEALGELNDLAVARSLFQAQRPADAHAAFALHWLATERQRSLRTAARRLQRLAAARRPWRPR